MVGLLFVYFYLFKCRFPEDGDHYNMDISQFLRFEYFKRMRTFLKHLQSIDHPKKKLMRALPWNNCFHHFYRRLFYSVEDNPRSGASTI